MTDPRRTAAAVAGTRHSRNTRLAGWVLAVLVWAIASEAQPLVALLSLGAALVLRGAYLVLFGTGRSRSVFWSPWFFAVAAACEVAWLLAR